MTGGETAGPPPGEPTAAQWSARYDNSDTPWDLGRAHPELERRLAEDPGLGGEVGVAYVPGCGRGHDAVALAAAGWDVVAVDMAPAVAEVASVGLAPFGGRFVVGDALDPAVVSDATGARRVDLVFDHTFFCALPLRRRPELGDLVTAVGADTSRVVSVVFPIGRDHAEGGPPWGMTPEDVDAALGSRFTRIDTSDPFDVPGRGWRHRWCEWRRLSGAAAS